MQTNGRVKVAILGSGNIGTDLMYKILKDPGPMELVLVAGIDPNSEGLARARALGIHTSIEGIKAVLEDPEIRIVFDATSAKSHIRHAKLLREAGKVAVDLTPAAVGPYVVPPVNLGEHIDAPNVNLITCGGQATIPLVYAVSRVMPVQYAEIVSTVASRSAGPGTRQNIDEFTSTTARGLEVLGNPESEDIDPQTIRESVEQMVAEVQRYVPGYRLKNPVHFDKRETPWGERTVIAMLLEIEGAGDYLPPYAGNLDIMTSAAKRVGELIAQHMLAGVAA